MEKINLELEFKAYLERVKLNPKTMSTIQLTETKRAFYAGLSQMWALIIKLGQLPEENSDVFIEDIEHQITNFWLDETIVSEFGKEYLN